GAPRSDDRRNGHRRGGGTLDWLEGGFHSPINRREGLFSSALRDGSKNAARESAGCGGDVQGKKQHDLTGSEASWQGKTGAAEGECWGCPNSSKDRPPAEPMGTDMGQGGFG